MSFFCKACGRQRAGSPAEGEEVCDECRPTQAGRAFLLLKHFETHRLRSEHILRIDALLGEAQNGPLDGAADGSLAGSRWTSLNRLMDAARNFNDALDYVQRSTTEKP